MPNVKLGNDILNGVNTVRLQKADGSGYESFLANPLNAEWQQCPEEVRNYLTNVNYSPNDYTVSYIENYLTTLPNDKPIGTTVDGITYYNEVPNINTPFASTNAAGTLTPLNTLRMINGSTYGHNIRDLGGWTCDGGTVKYGMLYRGADVFPTDPYIRPIIVGECGVRMELDLRGKQEEPYCLCFRRSSSPVLSSF